MRYRHEFGDHGMTKDSMVSFLEVSDHKIDIVGMKWSAMPNCMGRVIYPRGVELYPGRTPQNCALYGFKSASDMFNAERLFLNRMSMELPPSMSTLSNCTLLIQGLRTRAKRPRVYFQQTPYP
jgi:hypothetical protein